jgi:hypothetical protein
LLDDVRVYSYALGADGIESVVNRGTTSDTCIDLNADGTISLPDVMRIAENWQRHVPALMINEIVADNKASLSTVVRVETSPGVYQNQTVYPDWIEVLNTTSDTISLTGWSLTDNPADLTKWPFPAGKTIASGGFLVVFASNKEQEDYPNNFPYVDVSGNLHTNFNLSKSGEYLALVDDKGNIVHAYDQYVLDDGTGGFPPQQEDISYGVHHYELLFSATPTPGRANTEGFIGFVDKPDFNYDGGFYKKEFDLIMSCDTPRTVIRYTTDGSEPTETGNGTIYTEPVHIAPGARFPYIRARAFRPGYRPSAVRTASFIFNASDAVKSLPVVSIVGDEQKSLFRPYGIMAIAGGSYSNGPWQSSGVGSYNNPMQRGIAYERPVSVEILNADGDNDTQVDCGIRVEGSDWHRPRYQVGPLKYLTMDDKDLPMNYWTEGNWKTNYWKFSLKLFFRDTYGDNSFDYQMFPLLPVDSFKSVNLRGGHNDVMNPFIKDEFVRRLHKDMGRLSVVGTLMNLYINGYFTNYYNPTERLDDDFFRNHFNSDNEWDVITQRTVRNGDNVAWNSMLNFFYNNNLAEAAKYQQADALFDIPDFIDYLIAELYANNWDWPQNNYTAARERIQDAKFRFYLWDVEGSFVPGDLYAERISQLNSQNGPLARIYRALKVNPDFKQLFADRIQKHFFNDGALTRPNLEMRFQQLRKEMSTVLPSMDLNILNSWIPNRTNYLVGEFNKEGLFPLQGPVLKIEGSPNYGGYIRNGAGLTIERPGGSGSIWYTTDGTDPRIPVTPDIQTSIVVPYSAAKYVLVPNNDIDPAWQGADESFDDSTWKDGWPSAEKDLAGVGYDRNPDYKDRISYDVESKLFGNEYRSALIRIHFDIDSEDLPNYNRLTLNMRYDDGFVAYINGSKVHTQGISGTPGLTATVTSHDDNGVESFDIRQHVDKLRAGDNVLAIHGMNVSRNSSDFIMLPELVAGTETPGGGGVSPRAAQYTGSPVLLDKSTRVKARILNGSTWSALSEAVYVPDSIGKSLHISEIMYHPDPNTAGPDSEFIELQNTGDTSINLNLARFTNGIDFRFGNKILQPDQRIVLVANRTEFLKAYPGKNGVVAGQYAGRLDNGGEKIRLEDALGRTITEFTYDDDWFDIADGDGFSLTLEDSTPGLLDGLQAFWKMDETFGRSIGDCSGNTHNGSISEGAAAYRMVRSGKSDLVLNLRGIGDYVIVPNDPDLNPVNFTVAFWTKVDGKPETYSTPICSRDYSDSLGLGRSVGTGYNIYVDADNKWQFWTGTGDGFNWITGPDVEFGTWTHVAATFEATSGPTNGAYIGTKRLYINGSEITSATITDAAYAPNTTQPLTFGRVNHAEKWYFDGCIDDVLIYNRSLNVREIQQLAGSDDIYGQKMLWRPSARMGGSPGADDTDEVYQLGDIVISEILAHSHDTLSDWIELQNTTDLPKNIGGWFLSDDNRNYMKYRIPDNTEIPEHGYVVFRQSESFGANFALSENGETLYLRSGLDTDGNITGYYEEESFGASETNVAFGRYQKSTGAYNFVAMSDVSPGEGNKPPKVGPIVISEIMYHPAVNPWAEYVELFNTGTSGQDFVLRDDAAGLPWIFVDEGGIEMPLLNDSYTPITMKPQERILLVKNRLAFDSLFTAPQGTQIYQWPAGSLANGGEKIEISKPGDVDETGKRCYIRMDRVVYDNKDGWPTQPGGGADTDGDGVPDKSMALDRIIDTDYGNDVINWQSADPSPGL